MMNKRYEASSLEEACKIASEDLNIAINKLDYKIIQYPSKGFLGLFKKNAIIEIIKIENEQKIEPKEENIQEKKIETKEENDIVDSFFNKEKKTQTQEKESIDAKTLEDKIKTLFSKSCFDIDTIEVDIEDNTAYVFIDGNDAALLIGKEGYRYNALSYMIFSWINAKYGLYLKLEIAQFLASQQDMIINLMQPVIEHVKREGWGKTKELNGILVQIALEYLRDTFPNKYVAIKRTPTGEKYILINDFNNKRYE